RPVPVLNCAAVSLGASASLSKAAFRRELREIKVGLSNYAAADLTALVEYLHDRAAAFDRLAEAPRETAAQFRTGTGLGLGLGAAGATLLVLGTTGVAGVAIAACGAIAAAACDVERETLVAEATFFSTVAGELRDLASEIGGGHVE
ncbi:MAG: hypothetical protein AAFV86_24085, partial [Pseudomonadota bacterium]